jgi:hypothetical protein
VPIALVQTDTELSGASCNISIDGTMRTLQAASDRLSLKPQETIVLYIKDPGDITAAHIPPTAVIAIFTQNNLYYKEVEVVDTTFTNTFQGGVNSS